MDSQGSSSQQDTTSVLRNATFAHGDAPAVGNAVSASDVLLGAYDPTKLHPMAALEDKLDYLLLEDDKTSDLPGSGTAIPSRGWSDDLSYGTGTMYLSVEPTNTTLLVVASELERLLAHPVGVPMTAWASVNQADTLRHVDGRAAATYGRCFDHRPLMIEVSTRHSPEPRSPPAFKERTAKVFIYLPILNLCCWHSTV
ncbi:hypothetical protein PHLCEN_2v4891 [Hermanssonia centrifuga]|uniref:Uncharacterized protein n=1 Tax=Hermanssonia centrifuga TaxID=98765 RepID=A0A2R6PGC7_9APHY|nr:hypothetical protein PHLCEN_2v4891 [Hermanssonia centrifuga]